MLDTIIAFLALPTLSNRAWEAARAGREVRPDEIVERRISFTGVYARALVTLGGVLFVLLAFVSRRRIIEHEREKARRQTDALEATVAARTAEIAAQRESLRGYRFTYAPKLLRHFTARFEPLT